jgi:hypothetical protein
MTPEPIYHVTAADLDRFRQWFENMIDTNERYTVVEDFVLARQMYEALGRRITGSFEIAEQSAILRSQA